MTTDGAGGLTLSVAALEHCLACWDDAAPLDAAIPAAREQLAALVEAAGRAGALAAALAALLNGGRWSDGYGARKYEVRLTGDEHAALHDLLAEAGPGAAGARDETTPGARHPRCTSGQCAIVGACCYSVCIGPLVEALGEGEGERAWFTALRAGGAGDKEAADGG